MKNMKRRIMAMLLLAVMVSALVCNAMAAGKVTMFSDVPKTYWAYQTIMDMTAKGLFNGTSEPINGVGTFEPKKAMTRAEFITVAMRAIYPMEAQAISTKTYPWWQGYYDLALEKKIVKRTELDLGALDKPMSREEMAMIMVRCVEANGESLGRRVKLSAIADYTKIGSYYQSFVWDCFSYGLLAGIDPQGTFAPKQTLIRAEAATALYRLIDKEMRVEVNFENEHLNPNKPGSSIIPNTPKPGSGTTTPPAEQPKPEPMPWEAEGAKQPKDYTWPEFDALTETQKEAFGATFGELKNFETWYNKVKKAYDDLDLPWKNGGKQPSQYTWEEFNALSESQKKAFSESFRNSDAFEKWLERVQPKNDAVDLPWENGGKQPEDYTWAEFEALSPEVQDAFCESFGSDRAFEEWAQAAQGSEVDLPLGKDPEDYTWAEFEALSEAQKAAFCESFEDRDGFEKWMERVQRENDRGELPLDKDPEDYTWAEFEALTEAQKDAFSESFRSTAAFEAWLERAQHENDGVDLPLDKDPEDYTWAEFEALTEAQKSAFSASFRNSAAFEAWLERAQRAHDQMNMPWENGGKQPEDYTWAEFEALTEEQKSAFCESFESSEALTAWFEQNMQF